MVDVQKKQKSDELTLEENKEFHVFFENELHSMIPVFAIALILCAAIYAVSILGIEAESRLIYVLYRIFLISIFIGFASGFRVFSLFLAMSLVDRGRFTVFRTKNYRHCMNYSKKNLEGRHYYVLHVLWYRYAFRISSD